MQSATDDFKTAVQEAQGNDPPPALATLYKRLYGIGESWRQLGYNAALKSLKIPSNEVISACGAEIAQHQTIADLVTDLIKSCFYDGYALAALSTAEAEAKDIKPPTDPGLAYIGKVVLPSGKTVPIFEPQRPKDRPDINTVEGWTALANGQTVKPLMRYSGGSQAAWTN